MAKSPAQQLATLLADSSDNAPLKAIQAVQYAFAWCATVATPNHLSDADDALEVVLELYTALEAGNAYLTNMPALFEQAGTGQTLEQALQDKKKALEQSTRQLTKLRKKLKLMQQQEQKLQAQQEERQQLEARLAELERLAHMTVGLEDLREQVAAVEQRRSAAEYDLEQLENQLEQHTGQLVTLSADHLKELKVQIQQWLAQAEQQETELQETYQQWQSIKERYRQVGEELGEHREVLRLYLEADQAVAEAMGSSVDGVVDARQVLDRAQKLLADTDAMLKKALAANAAAQRIQPISLGRSKA